jgi:hypothetical protein
LTIIAHNCIIWKVVSALEAEQDQGVRFLAAEC